MSFGNEFNKGEERKEVGFSKSELTILEILDKDRREMYALEIIALSNGELARGTIYLYLSRLEENNFVSSRPEDNPKYEGLARSLYKITNNGVRAGLSIKGKKVKT